MPIRPILRYPDPRLLQVSKPVTDRRVLRDLVIDMAETMFAAKGAGLAAIQVGELWRVFIIDAAIAGGSEEDAPIVFINPELIELSSDKETADEGCLSFPGIYVPVTRSLRARIRAMDIEGRTFEMEGSGLFARALQHESDHLDGRLLSDFVGRIKRQMIARKLKREAAEEADEA
jgi:peptide deformylase